MYPSASAKHHKVSYPPASAKAGAEVGEGALLCPTPPLSSLPCGWELNLGCPVPEWGGHWKVLNNWPSSAQLRVWPSLPPKLCHGTWLVGSYYEHMQYRDGSWPQHTEAHFLRESCLVEESLFAVFFFFFHEIMHKTHRRYICYWWNFNENWNRTRINVMVFFFKFDMYFLDPVIDLSVPIQ